MPFRIFSGFRVLIFVLDTFCVLAFSALTLMVRLSVWSELQVVCIRSSWCHFHPKTPSSLASFEFRQLLPFWYRLTQVVLEKRPLNRYVSVDTLCLLINRAQCVFFCRVIVWHYVSLTFLVGWLGSQVDSVLDSVAEGPEFKSQPRRCRVTVLGKLFTPIVPLVTKQRYW